MKCPRILAALKGLVGLYGRDGVCTNDREGKYGMCRETRGWRRSLLAEAQAILSGEDGI